MANKSGAEGQVIALPKGGGAVRGLGETFSPDPQTGTGSFTIPIAVPGGRSGLQPTLSLVYSTGSGNGPFGLGWSLSTPGVTRKRARGIPRYRDQAADPAAWDTFVLSGTEDLVPLSEGAHGSVQYRPRTEGLFSQILRHQAPDRWEVRSPDGLVSFYGEEAVLADPADPARIFSWPISRTVDPFGNQIVYTYDREDGQLYLSQVRYGDWGDPAQPSYLTRIQFIYEERPDPFTTGDAGFEVRTARRCKRIEVWMEPEGTPIPVSRCHLTYADQLPGAEGLPLNGVSLLAQVQVEGVDGTTSEWLPPLSFQYTGFDPAARRFQPLTAPLGHLPERGLGDGEYDLVDLFGNGLPDVIQMAGSTRFWRNLGGGRFDLPRTLEQAPAAVSLAAPGVQLADLNGDGRADLLVTDGARAGYYSVDARGGWEGRYRRWDAAPSFALDDPEVRLIDLDGDGVVDALRTGAHFELYYHDAETGWHRMESVARRPLDQFPNVQFSDPRVKLADMNGDGLQDIVLIHDGQVDYWPYLGHGRWGRRRTMTDSPRFEATAFAGTGYDSRRLLLGDVDGDGLADLVYVGSGQVTVWINQSGNGWSHPVTIHGTPPVTDVDSVRLADMLGTGTAGILWTYDQRTFADSTYKFLDLTGGVKPYLLCQMDNNLGAVTRLTYASSIEYYLADEPDPATRWQTTLPFPVQVVARVEVTDAISGGRLTTRYRYRHGYWDGVEREFRGFGLVEQYDTEEFTGAEAPTYCSPPTMTRTWFHQGPVCRGAERWVEPDYTHEYWPGDVPLLGGVRLPDLADDRARRDAVRTLRGSVLRSELYTLEGPPDQQARPFTVTEHLYSVRQEAADGLGQDVRIFFPYQAAERSTRWERGSDPMTRVDATLALDAWGQPTNTVSIAVPRGRDLRAAAPPTTPPYLVTQTITQYARGDQAERLLVNRVARASTYEVAGDPTLSLEGLLEQLQLGVLDRQLNAQTVNFYDGEPFTGLPFGQVGAYGAAVRTETLALTPAALSAVYPDQDPLLGGLPEPPYWATDGAPAWPAEYPPAFAARYPTDQHSDPTRPGLAITPLGYGYSDGGGTAFSPGYFVASKRVAYDFQLGTGSRGLPEILRDPLGQETRIDYDSHAMLPTAVTDPAGLTLRASYDYRVMQPSLAVDANGNRTLYRFTPLGHLASVAELGKEGELGTDTPAEPGTRFHYAWTQPAVVTTIRRVHPAGTESGLPPDEQQQTIISVQYSDGFGRALQTRTQAEPESFGDDRFGRNLLPEDQTQLPGDAVGRLAPAPRVVVSGWQVYDNKGRVVERYEPFFDTGWDYQAPGPEQLGLKTATFYDALGNPVRTLLPDGAEQRVVRGVPLSLAEPAHYTPTPWEQYLYDANDNAGRTHGGAETLAYQQHWNTPSATLVDPLGREVERTVRNGPDPGDVQRTRQTFDLRGNLVAVRDSLDRLIFQYRYDLAGRQLRSDAMDGGQQRAVLDAAGNAVEHRNSKESLLLHTYDGLNRINQVWARDVAGEPVTLRQVHHYGDSPESGLARSVAAAANLLGKPYRHYDEAGLLTFERYDFKGNLLEKVRQVLRPQPMLSAVSESAATGWQVRPFRVDWQAPDAPLTLLEPTQYRLSYSFDGLGRLRTAHYPAEGGGARRTLRPRYNRAGALERVELDGRPYVRQIAYNARGQRTLIAYAGDQPGSGFMTRYTYDSRSRLVRLRTERYAVTEAEPLTFRAVAPGEPLQELGYAYDLAGNLLTLRDRTPASGCPGTPLGAAGLDRRFTYDPLYRLISATGRECDLPPANTPWSDQPRQADHTLARPYTEQYTYDPAGNLLRLRHLHHGTDGTTGGFDRQYLLAADSNRLSQVTSGPYTHTYHYDACGNLTRENTDRHYEWDQQNRLRLFRTQTPGAEPTLYAQYLYDAGGQRVMKLVRKQGGSYAVTVYVDGLFEHHLWDQGTSAPKENCRIHLMDDQSRIAILRSGDPDDATPDLQFHLSDHLGSSALVVDGGGQWVNREEYTPYGETSFGGFSRKRYRFTGKERDEESGLSYHAARYYAPWLCRWTACDPLGYKAGPNLYSYVSGRPMNLIDPRGTNGTNPPVNQCQAPAKNERYAIASYREQKKIPQSQRTGGENIQGHHPTQNEWAKQNIPGYNGKDAPTQFLETKAGTGEHTLITTDQQLNRPADGQWQLKSTTEAMEQAVDQYQKAGLITDEKQGLKALLESSGHLFGINDEVVVDADGNKTVVKNGKLKAHLDKAVEMADAARKAGKKLLSDSVDAASAGVRAVSDGLSAVGEAARPIGRAVGGGLNMLGGVLDYFDFERQWESGLGDGPLGTFRILLRTEGIQGVPNGTPVYDQNWNRIGTINHGQFQYDMI